MKWTAEQEQIWQDWLGTRPPAIREVAERLPPNTCYRSTANPGHYRITTYSQPVDGSPVTVKLLHLEGSFGYGVSPTAQMHGPGPAQALREGRLLQLEVFGVDPTTLVPCGCINQEDTDGQHLE